MTEAVDDVMWRLTTAGLEVVGNATTMASSPDSVFQSIDRYITPVWYILGIPGNLLAYCVWIQPKMRRSSGVYLASLALDECLFLVMQVTDVANYGVKCLKY